MKRPNLLTASIGDILTWSTTHNGKVKSAKLQEFIASVLSRASYLDRVKEMRWSANKWADRAWNDMQAIGVTETQELNPAKPPHQPTCTAWQMKELCESLGLYYYQFNGRPIITQKPVTIQGKVTMVADLPPSERGESSPELMMD